MRRDGTLIPPEELHAIKKKQQAHQMKGFERRTKSQKALATQKSNGPYYCPECSKYAHKKVEFATPAELGRHRRFTHKIPGQSKTALKSRQLTLENRIKAGEIEAPTAPAIRTPASVETTMFPCPHCPRKFETARGLGRHTTTMHKTELIPTLDGKEITTNGNGSYGKAGIVHQPGQQQPHQQNGKDITHETAQALIVAYAAGQCKGLIAAIADQHDIPSRFLAVRCAQSILSEAKR